MTKRVILVYFICIHLLLGIILIKSDFIKLVKNKLDIATTQSEITDHYYRMISYHSRMDGNVPDQSVIFIGDSITEGLAVSAVASPSVNFGIGNDTTVGVLKRLSIYKSMKRASAVVVAIGLNDLEYRSNEEIFQNMKAIANQVPPNVPLVISAILPIDEKIRTQRRGRSQERIKALNLKIKELTEKSDNRHIFFVDAGPLLIDSTGNLAGEFHEGDGIHLNSRGNSIWIQQLQNVIKSVKVN